MAMAGRLGIDDVTPSVGCGRWPTKAVVGEHVPVSATVWRDGHDKVAATVVWRGPHDRVAGQAAYELANDLEVAARLLDRVARRPDRRAERAVLFDAAATLRDDTGPLS